MGLFRFLADLYYEVKGMIFGYPVAPPERFPLQWCGPENRANCGMVHVCLYNCWDID